MRIAVLSDPHANLGALDAALDAAAAVSADEVWCLGDLVGLGPDPAECVSRLRDSCALVLAGNHDLTCQQFDPSDAFDYPPDPRWDSMILAAQQITGDDRDWFDSLVPFQVRHGIAAMHASAKDHAYEFVDSPTQARGSLDVLAGHQIGLCGHTHDARGWLRRRPEGPVQGRRRQPGLPQHLGHLHQCLLNPGAVGRLPSSDAVVASWLLLDLDAMTATWQQTPYDIAPVAARLIDRLGDAGAQLVPMLLSGPRRRPIR